MRGFVKIKMQITKLRLVLFYLVQSDYEDGHETKQAEICFSIENFLYTAVAHTIFPKSL